MLLKLARLDRCVSGVCEKGNGSVYSESALLFEFSSPRKLERRTTSMSLRDSCFHNDLVVMDRTTDFPLVLFIIFKENRHS